MRRRDFVIGAAGTASALYLRRGAAAPCPPVLENGSVICPAGDAEADWQARISDPGVVWYHDFRSDAEVDAFRWSGGYGNDPNDDFRPNTVRRNTSDGITGACLEIVRRAGVSSPAAWWRPYSPLDTGNGKPVADPGASGTIPVRPWAVTPGGSELARFQQSYYGHQSYHSEYPGQFDGTGYYLQARVKMDPTRIRQPEGGKLFYFTRSDRALTGQQIITISAVDGGLSGGDLNFFSMFRSGSPPLASDTNGTSNQPGSDLGFCDWPREINNCWTWSGGWDTILYHVVCGLDSGNDTVVQVWAAHPGETEYTKIWDQSDVDLPYDEESPKGQNALICSGFMNRQEFTADTYHRYCQLIFSKNFIACPQV